MSYLHRALLYTVRKKTKSLTLLLILTVIATLALSGAAVKDAAETAQLNVRQALGGIFTLRQNKNDSGKWVTENVGGYGSVSYYGGAPLTVELAEYIQNNVGGIAGYNATYTNYTVPVNESGDILKLIESETDGSGMNSLLADYGDFNSTVSTYASTNTAFDTYFTEGYLELTEGRHFTAKEQNAAIISRELAELNGLTVGDRITLRMSAFKASVLGYNVEDTCVTVEIVGLFQSTSKSTVSLSNWSMDNSVFTTLDAVRTARPDMGDESYEKISFYVTDPGEIDNIVREVQNLADLNTSDFIVDVDSSNVDAVTEPLANINRLVSFLIVLVLAVGAAVLCLVLSARIKERVHESGILLSLGLTKQNIAAQYLAEVWLTAVLAFTLSFFTGGFTARTAGSQLMDYTVSDSVQTDSAETEASADGIFISGSGDYAPQFEGASSLTQIEVRIAPASAAAMFGIGFLIITAAVLIAAAPVLKMKPREIISKMS